MSEEKLLGQNNLPRLDADQKDALMRSIEEARRRARRKVLETSEALRRPVTGSRSKYPGRLDDPTLDL